MVISIAALVTTLACVIASARRMWFAANPTVLHPDDVVEALGAAPDGAALARLRNAVAACPDATWERELLEALAEPRPAARVALVNEQLSELDLRMHRWARVPRVCASIATSAGLLLATLVLRSGLAAAADPAGAPGELLVREVLGQAMAVAALGIVGTTFCIGAHAHARRMSAERLAAVDRMIDRLEAAASVASENGVGFDEDCSVASGSRELFTSRLV